MNNNNIYYKVLTKDMKSTYQEFQYELNKKYEVEDINLVELCNYGFHVCKEIYKLIIYCNSIKLKDCRFFKCIIGDIMEENNHMVASNSITLIEELDKELVIKEIEDHLNILINDDWVVRASVADQGYGLDILINDTHEYVRAAVAYQGYGLDILIKDYNEYVRHAVARQGYGLDKLINDPDYEVRQAVARQGYGLDKLSNDPHWLVRQAVALKRYELDKLINDPSWAATRNAEIWR